MENSENSISCEQDNTGTGLNGNYTTNNAGKNAEKASGEIDDSLAD